MRKCRNAFLVLGVLACSSLQLAAQDETGWRIVPMKINIQVGDDRPLQLLDDSAQELHGAVWSVDNAKLGDLQEIDGREVLHAKATGTVRVTAILGTQVRFREIKIWSDATPMPEGTVKWSMPDLGHDIRQLAAVPTEDGPNMYSLEQTIAGSTYLRAYTDEGFQLWAWHMPEDTREVELVCGDWLGGAEVSANREASYTLYAVGKDGRLRWQHKAQGLRKGLAINTDGNLYLLTQSVDGGVTSFTALSELSGERRFEAPVAGFG